jgi:hypothetical protein
VSTFTVVVLAIWNASLIGGFVLAVVCRRKLLQWFASEEPRPFTKADADWMAFLADHPELR